MKKVMAFGSFDVVHEGHKKYLEEAKSHGDYLIVVVARDKNIEKFKNQQSHHSETERLAHIRELPAVDEAVLGNNEDIFRVVEEHKPAVLCLGYDQKTVDREKLKEELGKRNVKAEIVRAKPFKPEIYKSSKLKNTTIK